MHVYRILSSLAFLSVPCLVMTGLSYGLGVGPAAYVLMSTIFTQKMKSTGVTTGQVVKAIMVTLQLKVITTVPPSLPSSLLSSLQYFRAFPT